MSAVHLLQRYWERIMDRLFDQNEEEWLRKKVDALEAGGKSLRRVTFELKPYHRTAYDKEVCLDYLLHVSMLVKDGPRTYLEEGIYEGRSRFSKGEWLDHRIRTERPGTDSLTSALEFSHSREREESRFTYDRRAAVRYADRWWDSYNPAYRHFDVDCTNYVSQCLRAGGAPMHGSPARSKGWWYGSGTWSYSWTVAHALRWYMSGARKGLTATEVSSADQLSPGDIICYDFQGNGRFDHNTIVTRKDASGMPLVNAHTSNSRHRYWAYEDSTAYTPSIQYKFFRIDG
ncbi:amidase domain-containing protein [Halobacillus sp. ACCC02827]|uniref:amidase domain-containing protein n=1 Tax=Halobacillus sp. ACCC02827 TaxID=3052090 RepID=UPI00256FBC5A|nr:amidase domain-containing protein [Halobacillus sp. ACCC02827]WJE16684.1 amidase domain-containing protein [Halobacillus sp. ACCC02827]